MQKHPWSPLFALVLVALLSMPVTVQAPSERQPDLSRMNPSLFGMVTGLDPGDTLEVIIQFRNRVTPEDRRELGRLGFETIITYHAIPAVYAIGTVDAILSLSGYPRTFWMEFNHVNELYLHETTTVIGANRAWTSEVVGPTNADMSLHVQSRLSGIDGSGVTIAIVDTGIDGEHPDFDYGEKLIRNLHKNGPNDPWIEMKNSDTSYGHGTHCAGIAAGNGDASAGIHRGVAPAAQLIGVGGDWTPVYWAVLEGLQWVYDNSRPGNNPHNIRVVSNSWGGAGDYDPRDAITLITTKLMMENNVVSVFAAGNAGSDNHDGASDTTGQQSKIPAVISVAATTHDGTGMAGFSSRGRSGDRITYPDIAAPGVNIWATRPRYTWISEYRLQDEDAYYMSISGTSMACPHVSGLVALLFEAAPSLRVSGYREEDSAEPGSWGTEHNPYIHEAEYILKMTADMIPAAGGNGVPGSNETGHRGRRLDFAQGYGLVNAERAVAAALTLEALRMKDPDATVDQALDRLDGVVTVTEVSGRTDTLTTSWRGEWGQLTNGSNPLSEESFATDQRHRVYIPEEATFLVFDLSYNPLDLGTGTGGTIDATLDWNGDGNNDIGMVGGHMEGKKRYEIDLTATPQSGYRGRYWSFNVEGSGFRAPYVIGDEFYEALIQYTMELWLVMGPDSRVTIDETGYPVDTSPWRFGDPSPAHRDGTITITRNAFSLPEMGKDESLLEEHGRTIWAVMSVLVLMVLLGGLIFLKRRRDEASMVHGLTPEVSPSVSLDADDDSDMDADMDDDSDMDADMDRDRNTDTYMGADSRKSVDAQADTDVEWTDGSE